MNEILIARALDEVRPFLQKDGGDVELVEFGDDFVSIKLLGNCQHCSINQSTVKMGIETTLKKYLPMLKNVISV